MSMLQRTALLSITAASAGLKPLPRCEAGPGARGGGQPPKGFPHPRPNLAQPAHLPGCKDLVSRPQAYAQVPYQSQAKGRGGIQKRTHS